MAAGRRHRRAGTGGRVRAGPATTPSGSVPAVRRPSPRTARLRRRPPDRRRRPRRAAHGPRRVTVAGDALGPGNVGEEALRVDDHPGRSTRTPVRSARTYGRRATGGAGRARHARRTAAPTGGARCARLVVGPRTAHTFGPPHGAATPGDEDLQQRTGLPGPPRRQRDLLPVDDDLEPAEHPHLDGTAAGGGLGQLPSVDRLDPERHQPVGGHLRRRPLRAVSAWDASEKDGDLLGGRTRARRLPDLCGLQQRGATRLRLRGGPRR